MPATVRARGVAKRWGTTEALRDVTVDIGPGVTGLLGDNGAGKTTFIGLVLGLHPPDAGSLEVLGLDPRTAGPAVRARLGYAPEYDPLPSDVRAQDLVRHVAELHGLPAREALSRASETLDWVALGEERLRPCGTLSTGQRQRVKLAAAIAHDPSLVLLDEPTNGLDPLQREQTLALIRRVGTELGLHVVLSTHLLHEVERTCDAVIILRAGRVSSAGTLDEIRGRSDEAVVVEVVADGATVAAALETAGLRVRVDVAERLVVAVDGDDDLDTLRDVLADTGAGVRRLEQRSRSLEDVYLGAGSVEAVQR